MKKALWKAGKLSSCKILTLWTDSVARQIWWALETSVGDPELARQKIESIFFHIQASKFNQHSLAWTHYEFVWDSV